LIDYLASLAVFWLYSGREQQQFGFTFPKSNKVVFKVQGASLALSKQVTHYGILSGVSYYKRMCVVVLAYSICFLNLDIKS